MASALLDMVIIGAGPAGLSAAVEAQRGGLSKVLVLEKGDSHSQMIRTYYKEGKRVDARYAGQEALCFGLLCLRDGNRESYLGLMDHVIQSHHLEISYKCEVWGIGKDPATGVFEVKTSQGPYFSKTVVIAIGRMGRPNRPEYYDEIPASLKSGTILFDVTSRELKGLKLLVVGGGDSAAEYCDMLQGGNNVTLSYRRAEFSKMNPLNKKILEDLIQSGKVRALMPSNITGIEEASNSQARVKFDATPTEDFDAVIYALGGMNPSAFLHAAPVQLDSKGEAVVNYRHESSMPGLYIVGDLLGKGHGGGSIIAGFNSAAEAVRDLMDRYFDRKMEPAVVALDHLNF